MTKQSEADIRALLKQLDELDKRHASIEHRLDTCIRDSYIESEVAGESEMSLSDSREVSEGVYVGERPATVEARIEAYRSLIAGRTADRILRGVVPFTANPGILDPEIGLDQTRLYIDPLTEVQAPESLIRECLNAAIRDAGRHYLLPDVTAWCDEDLTDGGEVRAVDVREMVLLRRQQVLTGPTGAGKTSFVYRLANTLATGNAEHLQAYPEAMLENLPILVPLPDMASWMIASRETRQMTGVELLKSYILQDLSDRNLSCAHRPLEGALDQGRFLLLLDGLDEVPSDAARILCASIEEFANHYPQGRYLVTAESRAYQASANRLDEDRWPVTCLAPFDATRIERFAERWYAELAATGAISVDIAGKSTGRLIDLLRHPDYRTQAGNPLLLTLLALIHTHHGKLPVPASRALLYEQAMDILIWNWELCPVGSATNLTNHLKKVGRDRTDLLMLFELLGYRLIHGGGMREGNEYDTYPYGVILEEDLTNTASELHPDRHLDWAQDILDMSKQKGGLLDEPRPGAFRMLHGSFAAYLSAAYLAHGPDFVEKSAALASDLDRWGDSILLATGFLVHCQREVLRPLELAEKLCSPQEPEADSQWRLVLLTGEILLEIGSSRVLDSPSGARVLDLVRHRLAALVEQGVLGTRERAEAADLLARLGDPRFEQAQLCLPTRFRANREKSLGFVQIPEGSFSMGSESGDPEAVADETGNVSAIEIGYSYWLMRYPVTVSEFLSFIAAAGYETQDWWSKAGWLWRTGHDKHAPMRWNEQKRFGNRPIVGLTWHEANAYAAWLDAQVRRRSGQIPDGYLMRLPTEAEWEKAARGAVRRIYAWGDHWQIHRCNAQFRVGHPTGVGSYPSGATPQGIMDMTGNVLEWCLTEHRSYPYDPEDGRNMVESAAPRVVRGGSWMRNSSCARTTRRLKLASDRALADLGLRLALARRDDPV